MNQDPENNVPGIRPPTGINPVAEPALDFPDKPLEEMTPDDYRALNFMAGLEVHQQLATRSKLFCRCPVTDYTESVDAEVLRHMRPTLSELGEYDGTALMEFKTRKEIVYLLERGTVCTYEIDDTPPFELNPEAVQVALDVCQLFNLNLVSELHVMRKQYLDGSIPTGFQRTAMMGLTGSIPFREPALGIDRELRIRQLSLEEDSCREVSDVGHRITFRTDRLGVPLTEVVTEPDLLTPWELQAGGRLVARVTRGAGRIRRGVGAARQDVNVSVAGGRRVEIKGVPHHRGLPLLVHNEAFRQLNLLRVREELRRRGVTPEMLTLPEKGRPWEVSDLAVDVSSLLARSEFLPVCDAMERGWSAYAVRLPGFNRLLTHRTQVGVTFANEIEDRLRVIACLPIRPFMIHSDLKGYGLSHGEWRQIEAALKATRDDTMVVVWGPQEDMATAVREVFLRALDALEGVPAETRQAFADGTTGFERILPGPDRMYPDTDTPPFAVPDAWVEESRARLGERIWQREDRWLGLGLSPLAARRLADAPWADLFDAVAPAAGMVARRVAFGLEKRLPHHRRQTGDPTLPPAERLGPLVRALEAGEIDPAGFEPALDRLLAEKTTAPEEILAAFRPTPGDAEALKQRVGAVVDRAAGLDGKPAEVVERWAMGELMPHLVGKLPVATVEKQLRAALGERS